MLGLTDLYEHRGDTQRSLAIRERRLLSIPRPSALKKIPKRAQERAPGETPGK
jgi:hypothetical protein